MPNLTNSKPDLRRHYRSLRKALSFEQVELASEKIANSVTQAIVSSRAVADAEKHRRTLIIGAYQPFDNEPDCKIINETVLHALRTKLPALSVGIAYPKIYNNLDIKYYIYEKQIHGPLVKNRYGIFEPNPKSCGPNITPNILLIPGLAFNSKGYRLGYGRGFFDSFLNNSRKDNEVLAAIGVAYDFQYVDHDFQELHDHSMDVVCYESHLLITSTASTSPLV